MRHGLPLGEDVLAVYKSLEGSCFVQGERLKACAWSGGVTVL